MKKISKRLVSLITAAVVTSGFLGTSSTEAATVINSGTDIQQTLEQIGLSEAVGGKYGTNTKGVGKEKTITIDGSFSDWSEDMLIAQGVANDEPRAFRGAHEYPVYDDYALYAAWDNDNLYIGWQIANPNDKVCGENGVGTNEAKPYNADQPQIIGLDIDPNKSATTEISTGKYVWERTLDFKNGVDTALYFSTKPGVGTPGFFIPNSEGRFSYDPEYCLNFKTLGIKYAYADGFLPSSMIGINGIANLGIDALYSESSPWEDLLQLGHNKALDTFYEMSIPLKSLGIDKDYLVNNGIGVFHASIYGSSPVSSLPHDKCVLDNALEAYSQDSSTSMEKEDLDEFTVPCARVGKDSGGIIITNPKISNVTSDLTSPQKLGKTITFNSTASGGTGSLKYQYEVNGDVKKSFSTSSKFEWTPTKAGNYEIVATVKDDNGKTDTKTVNYVIEDDIHKEVKINSFDASKTSPQKVGTSIKLTADAEGEGTIQYRFTATSENGTEVLKSYSSTNYVTWYPEEKGDYVLTVIAKDSNGNTDSKTMNYRIADDSKTLVINDITTSKYSPQKLGSSIQLRTYAEGEGTLSYKFVAQSGSYQEVIKDFSTSSSVTWTPEKAGIYTIYFIVKDSSGNEKQEIITGYEIEKGQASLNITSYNADKQSPQNVGTAIKLSASATGEGTVQYRFVAYSGTYSEVIKDFSTSSS
ncbi:MAG: hypothetical protein GX275_03000, partial [Clostridiales bacterium]|nr:hypothetical protein [Clostridiales bacterium]